MVMPRGSGSDQRNNSPYISIFLQSAEAKVLPVSILPKASFKLSIIDRSGAGEDIAKGMPEHRCLLHYCVLQVNAGISATMRTKVSL
jgi:hypothetical protein